MTDANYPTNASPDGALSADLEASIGTFVRALVAKNDEQYESELVHILTKVEDLVSRKMRMAGTKTDTRDLLGELLFTRMRRGMHLFLAGEDEVTELRASEWVMGLLFSVTTLSEFAQTFDQALIRANPHGEACNFASRTDCLAIEEVLQMLATGKHRGCLSMEKGDNRIDIYLQDGRVSFLDPHHLARRVMPGDGMQHREIPEDAIAAAEARRCEEAVPVILSLVDTGIFAADELREVLRLFGKEVLFDFMCESEPYSFDYRRLDELPAFAVEHDLSLGVTALLLEGSKLADDWQQMLTVFPDPDAALELKSDMYARMSDAPLSVMEIKLLSQLDGDATPRSLVTTLGLPLNEVYRILIHLSKQGILFAAGDADTLRGVEIGPQESSIQESMRAAFAALDANDDGEQCDDAIARVFGSLRRKQ